MTEHINKQDIQNDELICPITLEIFRDPVLANDGHVYEREAITRWILQHGTSPLTRQPLQITDLQSDNHLRNLSRQRRNSTVSYNAQNERVILPPLRIIPLNAYRVAPRGFINPVGINHSSNKYRCRIISCIILCIVVPLSIVLATIFAAKNFQGIKSIYSGILTSNSSRFNRLNSSSIQDYYYDGIQIRIGKDGLYEFLSESSIDMYGYLYQNSFNSTNIYLNLLKSNDDSGKNSQFYFSSSLKSTSNYILVATTYDRNKTGPFQIDVIGPTTVTFN